MLPLLFALAAASLTPLGNVSLTPLDAYVSTIDPLYKWHDTGVTVKFPLLKSTAHILNVTSQSWLTTKEAIGPNGNIWTHQVAVVIPQKLTSRGTATAVLTGGCNEDRTHGGGPKPPPHDEEYMELAATIADKTGVIVIVVYQIPNCHILYPSDPTQKHRSEDAMIAWAWRQYLDSKLDDPRLKAEWLPRLPMVKAGFACMKAAEEYVATGPTAVVAASEAAAIAAGASVSAPFQVKGWVVGGASKRGWTTWMVGAVAAQCAWCPKVIGITPLVPIVPFLNHSIHMQRRSLDGFTFAFRDYLDAGTVTRFDTPEFEEAMQIVDPGYYRQRLAAIPKLAVVSSDDEFMQLDWTARFGTGANERGWTLMPGEMHLIVIPNSEHSLASGIVVVTETVCSFVASIDAGQRAADRPDFSYERNESNGALTLTVPANAIQPSKAVLRHVQTLSKRRDFRWVRFANASKGDHCALPGIPGKFPEGGNCLQPMIFLGDTLHPTRNADNSTSYVGVPKDPLAGHFRGYYIELFYPSTVLSKNDMQVSTAGFVWPDTFPGKDCLMKPGSDCPPNLV